jgi:uncharacterized DUF497 family protein
VRFEWDDKKAAANLRKHGVGFDEAAEVFHDPYALVDRDAEHSGDEERFFVIGYSAARLLFVVFAERSGDVIRIISGRQPTRAETEAYEEQER